MIDKSNTFRKDFLKRVDDFDLKQLTKNYSATQIDRSQDHLLDERIKCYLENKNRSHEFQPIKDGACLGFALLIAIMWRLEPGVEATIIKAKKIISLTDLHQPLNAVQEEIFESFIATITYLQKQKAPYSLSNILKEMVDENNEPLVYVAMEYPLVVTKAELENLLKNLSLLPLSFAISSENHATSFKLEKNFNYFFDANVGFSAHVPTVFFSDFIQKIAEQTHKKINDENTLYHFNLAAIARAKETNVPHYSFEQICQFSNEHLTVATMAKRKSYLGISTLWLATKKNIQPIIDMLLTDIGVDPHGMFYFQPLHTAIKFAGLKTISLLLQKGANANAINPHGNSILINNLLLNTPEHSYKVEKFLLENKDTYNIQLDIQNKKGNTALIVALLTKHKKNAKNLIKAGANLNLENADGHFALQLIISNNFKKLFKLIVTKAIDFKQIYKKLDMNPLQLALFYRRPKMAESLLQQYPYDMHVVASTHGEPLIELAMARKSKKAIPTLLHYGADINQQNPKSGDTPLHVAVGLSNKKLLKIIFNAKPDISLKNTDGFTAYEEAQFGKDPEIIRYFLQYLNVMPQSNVVNKLNSHGMLANKTTHQKRPAPLANITNINTSPTKKIKVI